MERSGIAGNGSSEQVRRGSFGPDGGTGATKGKDVRSVSEPGTIPAMLRQAMFRLRASAEDLLGPLPGAMLRELRPVSAA
jgi:hypothetical protein